jgi:hypothetical protein
MAVTFNGNKIQFKTASGTAARSNPDLVEFMAAPDKSAWFDGLTALRKQAVLKAVFLKIDDLEQRVRRLERKL